MAAGPNRAAAAIRPWFLLNGTGIDVRDEITDQTYHNDSRVQEELPDFSRLEEPIVFPCSVVQEQSPYALST